DKRLSIDLEMFSRGGLAVLDAIESIGYDTLHKRPAISKLKQARLLAVPLVRHVVAYGSQPSKAARLPSVARPHYAAPPSVATITASYENLHRIARSAHSNFYYVFFLLTKPKRHALPATSDIMLTIRFYPTFDRLREYCYRVAGTVGLTCTHVFGFSDARALDLAEKLGLAFQLTNIIRDIHEDYKLGRVYLPEEDLARYNVSPED